jgi:hypothetical protein
MYCITSRYASVIILHTVVPLCITLHLAMPLSLHYIPLCRCHYITYDCTTMHYITYRYATIITLRPTMSVSLHYIPLYHYVLHCISLCHYHYTTSNHGSIITLHSIVLGYYIRFHLFWYHYVTFHSISSHYASIITLHSIVPLCITIDLAMAAWLHYIPLW